METIQPGCKPKILVVDDHWASRRHLLGALSGMDVDTRPAGTGGEALELATSWLPRVILMDINLPDSDGFVIARKIRQLWPLSAPPAILIMMSAENPRARQGELDALGIMHVIMKPVPGRRIRELILELLGNTSSRPDPGSSMRELRKLFIRELEQQLPKLESYLEWDDRKQAAFLVHQLIAAAAINGEKRLEANFRLLNRLLRRPAGAEEIARTYYEVFQAAQTCLYEASATSSG